ncbi:MAG: ABC transporter substrate-binding protein, partial [Egibacteraceae bacterium]
MQPDHAPRIASLIPSGTDVVVALGLADHLVGVSHECDHPAAEGLPVLTASVIDAAGRPGSPVPGEVDRQVTATVRAGDSLYIADRERLADLRPDLVLSQDVCDVCAVEGRQAAEGLPPGAELVMLRATGLAGLEADLRRVATAAGVSDRGEHLVADVRRGLDTVRR